MSKRQRNKARQFAEPAPDPAPTPKWATPTPEAYEGAGMEDLDAALEKPQADVPVVVPQNDEPIDFTDPDAKAAWLDQLADALIRNDTAAVAKLQAMIPPGNLSPES